MLLWFVFLYKKETDTVSWVRWTAQSLSLLLQNPGIINVPKHRIKAGTCSWICRDMYCCVYLRCRGDAIIDVTCYNDEMESKGLWKLKEENESCFFSRKKFSIIFHLSPSRKRNYIFKPNYNEILFFSVVCFG